MQETDEPDLNTLTIETLNHCAIIPYNNVIQYINYEFFNLGCSMFVEANVHAINFINDCMYKS